MAKVEGERASSSLQVKYKAPGGARRWMVIPADAVTNEEVKSGRLRRWDYRLRLSNLGMNSSK